MHRSPPPRSRAPLTLGEKADRQRIVADIPTPGMSEIELKRAMAAYAVSTPVLVIDAPAGDPWLVLAETSGASPLVSASIRRRCLVWGRGASPSGPAGSPVPVAGSC
jgi:hypothetical protein